MKKARRSKNGKTIVVVVEEEEELVGDLCQLKTSVSFMTIIYYSLT